MKLNASQLTHHLISQLFPIYVVSGEDPFLVQDAIECIRDAAYQKGFSERIRLSVEQDNNWENIFLTQTQNISLFSTSRLIELDFNSTKLSAASKVLQTYAEHPSKEIVLLIRTPKLDNKIEQSHWYKALNQIAVIIPIWPITIGQLPKWIMQRSKKFNLSLTKSIAEFIATQVEGNLLAANQALEKLSLLQITGTLDQQNVEHVVTDSAHFDIFTLTDSLLAGNTKRSIRILENLAAEGTELILILWVITRELRTIIELIKQIKEGAHLSTLFTKYRIFEKRQPYVKAFLQRHSYDHCCQLLMKAANIDLIIKGSISGNGWDAVKNVILKICMPSNQP